MKLWGGRFTKTTDRRVEEFNSSIQFDCRMYGEDIAGSIAHATMLAKQGIITKADKNAIVEGLKKGDAIITGPYTTVTKDLKPGDKVVIKKNGVSDKGKDKK